MESDKKIRQNDFRKDGSKQYVGEGSRGRVMIISSGKSEYAQMSEYAAPHYRIQKKLPGKGSGLLRIAFFSDMHNACTPEEQEVLLGLLDKEKPALVLCGGDMIMAKRFQPAEEVTGNAIRFLTAVAEKYPLYCATGNHEYRATLYPDLYPGYREAFQEPLREAGAIFLENEKGTIALRARAKKASACITSKNQAEAAGIKQNAGNQVSSGQDTIHHTEDVFSNQGEPAHTGKPGSGDLRIPVSIFGYDMDKYYYHRFIHRAPPLSEVNAAIDRPDPDRLNILLAHNPLQMQVWQTWGADLVLCGHYHGGVMRIGRHHGLISPDLRIFPGNAYGMFPDRRFESICKKLQDSKIGSIGKQLQDSKIGSVCRGLPSCSISYSSRDTRPGTVIVTSGIGGHSLPRINNPREIVFIDVLINEAGSK